MTITVNSEHKIPLALLVTLGLHLFAAIWWVSAKDRDTNYLGLRLTTLESSHNQSVGVQSTIMERLARIEERLAAEAAILERIEKQITPNRR